MTLGKWNPVSEGLPTNRGDYLVVREHAELHHVSIATTNFHPKGEPPWFDKGFIYLYWIGPISMPAELEMVGCVTKKRFEQDLAAARTPDSTKELSQ